VAIVAGLTVHEAREQRSEHESDYATKNGHPTTVMGAFRWRNGFGRIL
jgi:hypothetical protein